MLRKAALGFFALFFTGLVLPICAEVAKSWLQRQGYIDDPASGLFQFLEAVKSLGSLFWFYPAFFYLFGVASGVLLVFILSNLQRSKSDAMKYLGGELRRQRQMLNAVPSYGNASQWRNAIGGRLPPLEAILVTVRKNKIWAPTASEVKIGGPDLISDYLSSIGSYLLAGHLKEATNSAAEFEKKYSVLQ